MTFGCYSSHINMLPVHFKDYIIKYIFAFQDFFGLWVYQGWIKTLD